MLKNNISYIDPEYKKNILLAIKIYETSYQNSRINDIKNLTQIISENYESHNELINLIITYLNNMHTGFYFLGIKSLPIRTGHSKLKNLILKALKTKSFAELTAYENLEKQKKPYSKISYDNLVEANQKLIKKITELEETKNILEKEMMNLQKKYEIEKINSKNNEQELTHLIQKEEENIKQIYYLNEQISHYYQENLELTQEISGLLSNKEENISLFKETSFSFF